MISDFNPLASIDAGIRRHRRSMVAALFTADWKRWKQSRLMVKGLRSARRKAVRKGVI